MTNFSLYSPSDKIIAIVGAGPAGLFAAYYLGQKGYSVHLFDHMARPGRKFLMAGRSGLNLTHSEALETFLDRYGEERPYLENAIRAFPPKQLVQWAESLGQPCFTGSSGRIFLKTLKASPLLRSWLERLNQFHVQFHPHHKLVKIQEQTLHFETDSGLAKVNFDSCILALGGASWPRLGSTGQWSQYFDPYCTPFEPSNCGFYPDWPESFCQKNEGALLKGITLTKDSQSFRGDLTLTQRGLEGAPLYALSPLLRETLKQNGKAIVFINFRPNVPYSVLKERLDQQRPRESRANRLRKAFRLDQFSATLIGHYITQNTMSQDNETLARLIMHYPLTLTATGDIDRAISTKGGLKFSALDEHFMIKHLPSVFACGEMLDWEAPTGGYLLQGCFSTAFACSQGVEHWLSSSLKTKL